jgi:hypothetical protein
MDPRQLAARGEDDQRKLASEPEANSEDETYEDEADEDETYEAAPARAEGPFRAVSALQLVLFALIGGSPYAIYWAYQNWARYRAAWGYSREPFWRDVYARTGYRVSPFFRSFLGTYEFCLFPAVDRECRALGLRGLTTPVLLAVMYGVLAYGSRLCGLPWRAIVSGAWPLLLVQLSINRMHPRVPAFRATAIEIGFVIIGGLTTWR